jgi:hypothetical protein
MAGGLVLSSVKLLGAVVGESAPAVLAVWRSRLPQFVRVVEKFGGSKQRP